MRLGDSKRAPFPSNWQNLSFSLDEVMAYSGVRCIGMRCGPDAGGILLVGGAGIWFLPMLCQRGRKGRKVAPAKALKNLRP